MGSLFDEFRAAIHAVWMRRWIAIAVAWGLCLAGWLVVSQIPNQYESVARVSVQLRSILPGQATTQADQQRDIDRVRQTLTSAVNMEKVVRGTSMANSVATDRDVADRVARLQKMVKITAQQDNLFEISATVANGSTAGGQNAKLSQAIVQKLIDLFVEGNLAGDREETSQSLQFLDQQIAARAKALQEAETKRSAFQARYLGSLPGTGSIEDRIGAIRNQIAQVESELAGAQSNLVSVNSQMAGTPQSVAGLGGGGTAGPARARVSLIEGQLAEARGRGWTDAHPDVIALKSQLNAARGAARGEPIGAGGGGSPNPLYLQLRSMQAERSAKVAELTQRKNQLQGDIARFEAAMTADPAAAREQAQIDRDTQVMKDQYTKLVTDREDVRLKSQVQNETDAVKFTVIDPPTLPRVPTAPNRPMLLTAVLIAGMLGGIGAAFALAQIRPSFATAGRLERASGMPVIGSIGEVLTHAQIAARRRRMRIFAGAAGGLGFAYVALIGVEFAQRGMMA